MGAELQEHILSQEKEADRKAKINSDPGKYPNIKEAASISPSRSAMSEADTLKMSD